MSEANLEGLGASFRSGVHELERAEAAVNLCIERGAGALSIIAAAADGAGADEVAEAIGLIAEAETALEQVGQLYLQAREKINEHLGKTGL